MLPRYIVKFLNNLVPCFHARTPLYLIVQYFGIFHVRNEGICQRVHRLPGA